MRVVGPSFRAAHSCSTASRKRIDAHRLDQNLDTRLVLVVAATILVVDTQDGFQVGEQVLFFQPLADDRADDRGAAQAAAGENLEADLAAVIGYQFDADIVRVNCCPVLSGAADRDFEFARQEGELRDAGLTTGG